MESMLRRVLATWTKGHEASSRRSPSAAMRLEALEGRQLLSTSGLFRGNAVVPVASNVQRGQVALRGSMSAQGPGDAQNMTQGTTVLSPGGPLGNTRLHNRFAGRGGAGARNLAAVRMQSQALPGGPTTIAAVNATTDPSTSLVQTQPGTASQVDPLSGMTSPGGGMATGDLTVRAQGGGVFNQAPAAGSVAVWTGDGSNPGQSGVPSDALKQDFDTLQADLQAIHDKSEVTPKLLAAVRNDFDAIQQAATSDPDQEALKTLAATVESLDGQIPTDDQQAQLLADFTAVLKSQGMTDQTLIDTTVADIKAVVAASHVTADDLATIAADREAIQNEMASASGATQAGMPMAADPIGSLFEGLTGGFETGAPVAIPFAGGVPGGRFDHFSIASMPAADGMGGPFNSAPMVVSPGGMGGQFRTSPMATTNVSYAGHGSGPQFSAVPTAVSSPSGSRPSSFRQFGGMGGLQGGP